MTKVREPGLFLIQDSAQVPLDNHLIQFRRDCPVRAGTLHMQSPPPTGICPSPGRAFSFSPIQRLCVRPRDPLEGVGTVLPYDPISTGFTLT